MIHYVAGLLFDEKHSRVLLLKKTHPEWQAGRFNAIGGKVEETDGMSLHAMVRECSEELGVHVGSAAWDHFLVLGDGRGWTVDFFAAQMSRQALEMIPNQNLGADEKPFVFLIETVIHFDDTQMLGNLRWIVPLAIQRAYYQCPIRIMEHPPALPLQL